MQPKILIVDDEPDVLDSTGLLIETLGYDVRTLSDASQILDTVEREKPDLILQDLKMPGLNVAGLVAALRTNAVTADIPIVFFSANADISTTAARYDVWGHLSKPFSTKELRNLLEQVLQAKGVTPPPATDRDLQKEIKTTFHSYWNLLAALGNYLEILETGDKLQPGHQRAAHGLHETLLKLEAQTDRLRSYLLSLAGSGVDGMDAADEPKGVSERKVGRDR